MQNANLKTSVTLLALLLCSCLTNRIDDTSEIIVLQTCACDTCSNSAAPTDTSNHNPIIVSPQPTGLLDPCWVNQNKDSVRIRWIVDQRCSCAIGIYDDDGNGIKNIISPPVFCAPGLHQAFWNITNDFGNKVNTETIYRVRLSTNAQGATPIEKRISIRP